MARSAQAIQYDPRHRLLQEVTRRAGHDGGHHAFLVGVGGKHDHLRVGPLGQNLTAGVDPVAVRQAHIHDHYVWLVLADGGDRARHCVRLADHKEITRTFEQRAQPEPQDRVIVDQQESNRPLRHAPPSALSLRGTRIRTVVPLPGWLSTVAVPPISRARSAIFRIPLPRKTPRFGESVRPSLKKPRPLSRMLMTRWSRA